MNKLLSIFGCGVQKGGTTSLYAHLCQHPALSSPSQKELHFFDDETNDWASPDYKALQSFFPSDDGRRLRFEITPIYIFWPPSIERVRAYNPAAKLIFLFRDPFERAWSQWCMEYARGNESLPFAEAIREGRQRMEGLPPLAWERRVFTYVERGLYESRCTVHWHIFRVSSCSSCARKTCGAIMSPRLRASRPLLVSRLSPTSARSVSIRGRPPVFPRCQRTTIER